MLKHQQKMKSITNLPLLPRLEYVLSAHLRPTFLVITDPRDDINEDIHIVVSAHQFSYMTVPERITHVFKIISAHLPEILQKHLIVIQAYDTVEMEEVLGNIITEEMFK